MSEIKEEPPDKEDTPTELLNSQELLRENLKDSAIAKVMKKRKPDSKPSKSVRKGLRYTEQNRCDICRKILSDSDGLRRHLLVHTQERPYPCSRCPQRFNTAGNRSKHFGRVHQQLKNFPCEECGRSFFSKIYRDAHMKIHTGVRDFECSDCGKCFNRKDVLRQHMYIHTGEKPYVCSVCDYACRDSSTLRKHKQRHTNTHKRYQCNRCDQRFDKKFLLKTHIASAHLGADVSKYHCDYCDKRFTFKQNIAVHIRTVHLKNVQWECSICGRRFNRKNNLDSHMSSHTDERPHKCTHCGKFYKSKGDLNKHMAIHAIGKHACRVCGRRFRRPERRARHEKVIHYNKRKLTPCPLCNVRFYSQAYVDKHVREKHSGKRARYECDECGATSLNKPGLVMHMRLHDKKKRYKCEICNRKFRTVGLMKSHCRDVHSVVCRTRFVTRKDKPMEIKQEMLDIEENEIEDKPDILVPSLSKEVVELSKSSSNLTEEHAGEIIRQNSKILNQLPESYFHFYLKTEKQPVKIYLPRYSAVSSNNCRPYEPAARPAARAPPAAERLRRNMPPVNYRDLVQVPLEEAPPQIRKRKTPNASSNDLKKIIKKSPSDSGTAEHQMKLVNTGNEAPSITTRAKGAKIMPTRNVNDGTNKFCNSKKNDKKQMYPKNSHKNAGRTKIKNISKCAINTMQCFTCLKLFPSREDLLRHCKQHFGIENNKTIKKCPFCGLEPKHLWSHAKKIHNVDLKTPSSDVRIAVDKQTDEVKFVIKVREKIYKNISKPVKINTKNASEFVTETVNSKVDEIEVIPSVQSLNRHRGREIEKSNRLKKLRTVLKKKLVKNGEEWFVEDVVVPVKVVKLTDKVNKNTEKEDLTDDPYLEHIHKLAKRAKNVGQEILFPCNKCEKVCLNFSAFKLHRRVHNSKAKPFKPKVWKHKLQAQNDSEFDNSQDNIDLDNELTTTDKVDDKLKRIKVKNGLEKAKPILPKNYQCDYKLMEFFRNNITGRDVDFEHFLREYRKIQNKKVNDLKEDSFGLLSDGIAAISSNGQNNGNSNGNTKSKVTNRLKNKSLKETLIKIALHRKLLNDKLRRKIAKEGRKKAANNNYTVNKDGSVTKSTDDADTANVTNPKDVFKGFSDRDISEFRTEIDIANTRVHVTENNISNEDVSTNTVFNKSSNSENAPKSLNGPFETVNEKPQDYEENKINDKLSPNYQHEDNTYNEKSQNYEHNNEPLQHYGHNDQSDDITSQNNERNEGNDPKSQNYCHNDNSSQYNEHNDNSDDVASHCNEHNVEPSQDRDDGNDETECNIVEYEEPLHDDVQNEMDDIMKLITDKTSNVQYEVVDIRKDLGIDFNAGMQK